MELSELQLNRQLYRTQPQTVETLGADSVASNLSAPPSTAIASGNSVTDVNTNAETINGAVITPGTIPAETLDVSNWGWTQTCVFTSASATQVNWGSGSFISANGVTYSIGAGNTGTMAAKTYIYLDLNVANNAYQHTTTSANAVGVGKVLVAVAQNAASTATFNLNVATQIVGDNILANTIDASKITAGTITATQISASYVYAGTISANSVTAGTLTGSTVQTSSGSDRVALSAADNDLKIYKSGVVRVDLFQDAIFFLNASGNAVGSMSVDSTNALALIAQSQSGGSIFLLADDTGQVSMSDGTRLLFYADFNLGFNISRSIMPQADVTYDIGSSAVSWLDSWFDGTMNYRQIAQPVLYFGYISGTTLSQSNVSWTITNPTTGNYTIAHNFGTTNYTIVATALRGAGAGAYSAKIQQRNSNDARVTIFDDTGTLVASDFMFLITKI